MTETSEPITSSLITNTQALNDACDDFANAPFIAIDTEFMRETTYYPQLCLIQMATSDKRIAVDPLAKNIDISRIFSLLADRKIVKVLHGCRQDLEIFLILTGGLPEPLFDTQIAAMVCGYGDQVGYEKLVKGVLDITLNKSARYTDWQRRPLNENQLRYALDDVTHLAAIYPILCDEIAEGGRESWLDEETMKLHDPATYEVDPMDAWKRVKKHNAKPASLNRLRYLAAWREREARIRDLPRNRVLRDDILAAVADSNPANIDALRSIRGINSSNKNNIDSLLKALKDAASAPKEEWPQLPDKKLKKPPQACVDLLKVLLKHCADNANVAPRLIASSAEIDRIATGERDGIQALRNWRGEIFGKYATDLLEGKITLAIKDKKLHICQNQVAAIVKDDL